MPPSRDGGPAARRTFDVIDICEIFTRWHAGRSKNEIAGSLGLSRNTVRKYVAAAEAAGMTPGGPAVSPERWAELAREWFPELADTRLRQVTWPAIAAHRDYIVGQLAAGVTVATIHQRLADERGLAVSVASLRRRPHSEQEADMPQCKSGPWFCRQLLQGAAGGRPASSQRRVRAQGCRTSGSCARRNDIGAAIRSGV
ncbi:MAG: hypothetical protein ACLQDY_24740, partial [Streptosporangiaceae bacterium]